MQHSVKELLTKAAVLKVHGVLNTAVSGIADNSKSVKKNFLFVAIKGLTLDAYAYIPKAIENGATVIVSERPPKKVWLAKVKAYIEVKNSRQALSIIAGNWFGNPAEKMTLIGVTGTDGKTTTSQIIFNILKQKTQKVGLLSTISAKAGSMNLDTGFHVTSPEPLELQKILALFVKKDIEYAVLEVTAEGLSQHRVHGIEFDVAVLTNITHENFDYHKSIENYRNEKLVLFENSKISILNADDDSFKIFYKKLKSKSKVISYGLTNKADFYGEIVSDKALKVTVGSSTNLVTTSLPGDFNKANVLGAIAVAQSLNVDWLKIKTGIAQTKSPSGRMYQVKNSKGINIVIDFAHTPNGLKNALTYLKSTKKGKLIAVFGVASERGFEKRGLMGQVAGNLADIIVITSEDPRRENPQKIINDIMEGASSTGKIKNKNMFLREERGEAITFALTKIAKKGDTVGIFGKGHEKSMAYNGIEYEWSDKEAVKLALHGKNKKVAWKK